MEPLPHRYGIRLDGGAVGHATLRLDGAPALRTAPPREFGGPGDAWGPEHLLLAAVAACFLFTLRAVASASRADFTAVTVEAEGRVDRVGDRMRFEEIVLRPQVRLAAGADVARARRAIGLAERGCLVSASLATPVRVDAHILPPEE